jgi:predicted nuclease of restriction endonuclease-like RecB superfamily
MVGKIELLSSAFQPLNFHGKRAYLVQQSSNRSPMMSQLKECESADRLSRPRNNSHRSFRQPGQVNHSSSGMEPDEINVKQSTFAEDFMLEHSNSSLFIAMMGSANRFGAPKEPAKSTQHFGFPA